MFSAAQTSNVMNGRSHSQEKTVLDRESHSSVAMEEEDVGAHDLSHVDDAGNVDEPADRLPALGKIGFIGLGHMGTAIAANLAAAGCAVSAYVRRLDQMTGL